MNKCLQLWIDYLMKQRYLVAMKEGVLSSYSFLLVGSLFLIPPLFSCFQEYAIYFKKLYIVSVGLFSIYVTFSMGEALGKSYEMNERESGLFSVFVYLISLFSLKSLSLNILALGLFIGIISSILTVETLRLTSRLKSWNPLPEIIPSAVSQAFVSLIPFLILCIVFGIVLPQFHFIDFIVEGIYQIILLLDNLVVLLIVVFLTTYFWSVGIHGATVVSMILRPFWICMIQMNGLALIQGYQTFFISPEPLLQWFVWIGGSGTTIGLSFVFRFLMKSNHNKDIGKTSWISSLVNINEPIIFGTPIVSNKFMTIPFIVIPMLCATITWFAFSSGWLHPICMMGIWTLPSPIGAFIVTGGDFRALLLNLGLIILSVVCYYPFAKIYDTYLLKKEKDML